MAATKVEPRREREPADGSQRFTAVNFHFDTRVNVFAQPIDDDWELQIKEQWRQNQSLIRGLNYYPALLGTCGFAIQRSAAHVQAHGVS